MLLLGEKKIKFPQAQPWIPTLKPNGVRMQRSNHSAMHHPAGLTNNSAPLGFPEGKRVPPQRFINTYIINGRLKFKLL